MKIYNRYIYRTLTVATIFVSAVLIAITMLTQSLRFLELIVESGASTSSFWLLTFLSLPRFLEIIIPIGLATSVLFTINKLATDSELVVLQATGHSFWRIIRPAFYASLVISVFLLIVSTWLAPMSLSKMQVVRQMVKTQFSALLFREGVFNTISDDLTVYIREKTGSGEFKGIVIQDERDPSKPVRTVYAQRGVLALTDEGEEVVVFDGARQDYNPNTKQLQRLKFERYTIKLPESEGPMGKRWLEPDERTFPELIRIDPTNSMDVEKRREFKIEAHKRIIGPLFAPVYCLIAATFLLLGSYRRQGKLMSIVYASLTVIGIQSLFIASMNAAVKTPYALYLAYGLLLIPFLICLYLLTYGQKGSR